MGGTILVSNGRGFATNTVDFDYLVERIRAELMPKHPSVAIAAYEPLDEGGVTFLSLEALDRESYRFFVEATTQAEYPPEGCQADGTPLTHHMLRLSLSQK